MQKLQKGVIDEKLCDRAASTEVLVKQVRAAAALPKNERVGRFIQKRGQPLSDAVFGMLARAAPSLRTAFSTPKTDDHDVLTPLSRGARALNDQPAQALQTLLTAEQAMLDAALKYEEMTELVDRAFALSFARKGLALRTAVRRVHAVGEKGNVLSRLRRARAKATATLFSGLAKYERHRRRYVSVPSGFLYPQETGFLAYDRAMAEVRANQRHNAGFDVRFKKVDWALIETLAEQRNALKRAYDEVGAIEAEIDAYVAKGAWSKVTEETSAARVLKTLATDVGTDDFGLISFVRRARHRDNKSRGARYAAFYLSPALGFPVFWDVGYATVVDKKLRDFLVLLLDERSTTEAVRAAAQQLFNDLFGVAAALGLPRRLIIASDGQLHRLPFVALADSEGRWLAERHEVSLYGVTNAEAPRPPRVGSALSAVAFIDPAPPRPAKAGPLKEEFGRLPDAIADVVALRKGIKTFQLLTDGQGHEAHLDTGRAPSVLHFGSHGIFLGAVSRAAGLATEAEARYDDVGPARGIKRQRARAWYLQRLVGDQADRVVPEDDELGWADAALVLAAPPKSKHEKPGYEGYLTAYEIAALNLSPTDLVVLAACESGVGGVSAWHGTFSLQSAFLAAGAKSVVASRWPVASAATAKLMNHFYKQLLAGKSRVAALSSAISVVRAAKETAHPYFWASFALTGARGPIVKR